MIFFRIIFFYRGLPVDHGDYRLAGRGLLLFVDDHDISRYDSLVAHGLSRDAQREIFSVLRKGKIDKLALRHGLDGLSRRNRPEHRDTPRVL